MKKQTAKSSKFKVLFSYKVLKETAYGMQVSWPLHQAVVAWFFSMFIFFSSKEAIAFTFNSFPFASNQSPHHILL